jgi:hypothetical protein
MGGNPMSAFDSKRLSGWASHGRAWPSAGRQREGKDFRQDEAAGLSTIVCVCSALSYTDT